MKFNPSPIKYISISLVLVFALLGLLPMDLAYADSPYLINDHFDIDFNGDGQEDLDSSVWYFRTHSNNNAYYEIVNGIIHTHSGVVSGSGGSIRTHNLYSVGDGVLVFETRAKETFADGGLWGFWGPNHEGVVLIGFNEVGILRIEVRSSNTVSATLVEFPDVNISALDWHTFRIELSNDYAKFFIDDEWIHTQTENIPYNKDLHVWVGRVSNGVDQIAYFDYVTLQSIPRFVSVPEPTPIPEDYRLFAYIPKYDGALVYVIDTTTNELVKTINVGLRPTHVNVSPFSPIAFTTNSDSGSVSVIDTITQEVIHTLYVGGEPYGSDFFMIDDIEYAYIANRPGYVNVIDVATMTEVDTFSAGSWVDSVKIHPNQPLAYVMNSYGNTRVVDVFTNTVISQISPRGVIDIHPDGSIGYAANYNSQRIDVFDTTTNAVSYIPVVYNPTDLAFSPDGSYAIASLFGPTNNAVIINTTTNSVIGEVAVGGGAAGVGFIPDGSIAYVSTMEGNLTAIQTSDFSTDTLQLDGQLYRFDFAYGPSPNQPPIADCGGPYTANEGDTFPVDASGSTDPDQDLLTYAWDLDNDGEYDDAYGVSPEIMFSDDTDLTISCMVTDEMGESDTDTAQVTINNVAPDCSPITGPVDPIANGSPAGLTASFTDPGVEDTHSVEWFWSDESTSGMVLENSGSGKVSGDYTYTGTGVYSPFYVLTDDDGGSCTSDPFEYVVIYDPESGFVTGGGWIDSPEGAYTPDPSLTGRATFGFVSKYKKGASVPTGQTEFQFRVAELNFHSETYQWLVIAGAKAMYKGTGTINGEGEYGFLLSAIDGELPGGGGEDKFRIKLWELDTEIVIYDNKINAPDDAEPDTVLEGGAIKIHKK